MTLVAGRSSRGSQDSFTYGAAPSGLPLRGQAPGTEPPPMAARPRLGAAVPPAAPLAWPSTSSNSGALAETRQEMAHWPDEAVAALAAAAADLDARGVAMLTKLASALVQPCSNPSPGRRY